MSGSDWLTTSEIGELFETEVRVAGGSVTDRFDDRVRLYLRATFPTRLEVKRGDKVRGGVALRAVDDEISVHPYVFREICSNGAIRAHATQSQVISADDFGWSAPAEVVAERVREAVRACLAVDVFSESLREMRSALDLEADMMLAMMAMVKRLPNEHAQRIFDQVSRQFRKEKARSRFGMMNAVTAVARETRDPEIRWCLEELGGAVPVSTDSPRPEPLDAARELVGV